MRTAARPWKVNIYQSGAPAAWETRVPHELIEDWSHTYQPKRKIVVYGDIFPGWEIDTKAKPLDPGQVYAVEIWSDGGRGFIEIAIGSELPKCPDA